MYRAYWGMEFNPFDKEIAERQFYKNNDFNEMTKRLEYLRNVREIGLFTSLTGTGKTACLRAFVNGLNQSLYKVIYLPMTTISASEFYRDLAKGLGLEPCYRKIDNFRNIQEKIRNLYREQKTTLVVLVDEAQYLGGGQPTLNNTLSMQIHEALRQRIVINYQMQGLTAQEVTDYARNRMKLCGVSRDAFEPAALEAAYGVSGGGIRRLNALLHRALIIGCEQKRDIVGTEAIMDAANEIDLI